MFFKKDSDKNKALIKIGALLIHAAKIDELYTSKEEQIIKGKNRTWTLRNAGKSKSNRSAKHR